MSIVSNARVEPLAVDAMAVTRLNAVPGTEMTVSPSCVQAGSSWELPLRLHELQLLELAGGAAGPETLYKEDRSITLMAPRR
ncbi:hypothetical protein BAUCODRAFT_31145 [Baudoinia panamericana UAMH 10762]|uniref:Uncharacterized protein n=1 Tax=Baudoinia panamericana (strain UAMH 10762) TaxID=717646 RepID=M2MQ19_BAUPA|nr:uncharacterized protein BAUCODRAFT_31145 [Baudoinia panamericana UAMH 10762]EMC98871.1 hypothetical protein BAUCODRAFT_31145 [Baudoinia panamericana UAMH 10762]